MDKWLPDVLFLRFQGTGAFTGTKPRTLKYIHMRRNRNKNHCAQEQISVKPSYMKGKPKKCQCIYGKQPFLHCINFAEIIFFRINGITDENQKILSAE